MSEVKHTPGPWNCLRRSSADRAIVCAETQPLDICVLSNRDKSIGQVNANALLIAAAPDLLKALKAMVEAHAIPSTGCKSRTAYEHAIAAITKAEGAEA